MHDQHHHTIRQRKLTTNRMVRVRKLLVYLVTQLPALKPLPPPVLPSTAALPDVTQWLELCINEQVSIFFCFWKIA